MASIFFSYSHRDEELRNELETHLALLKRQGLVRTWHDRRIGAGKDFGSEISENLNRADVILLLVSPYFLASEYCYEVEMKRALERHNSGEARVIPIILHPCDWHAAPFGHLRATPPDGKPISKFANIHDGFSAVAKDVRTAVEELGGSVQEAAGVFPGSKRAHEKLVNAPRTSNLRVKKTFTDRDRDDFASATFEYVANFFENSLTELEARNPGTETRFTRLDARHFSAAVYQQGEKRAACRIWLAGRQSFGGDMAYAANDQGNDNTMNEWLTITDDGYSLLLRSGGLAMGANAEQGLTQQGAAEHLWSMLIARLQ